MADNVIQFVAKLNDLVSPALKKISGSLGTLPGLLGLTSGLLGAGAALAKVLSATKESQLVLAKFDLTFRNLGDGTRRTRDEMVKFADAAGASSIFSDESILRAQEALLKFGVTAESSFKKARQVAIDLASVMGTDVESAATLVARAMQRPDAAIRQLRQAGVLLTKDQEKLIQSLVKTGDTAGAAAILMGELEKKSAGAGKVIAGTLQGSLQRLGNAFDNLFEGSGKASDDLAKSVGQLADIFNDPAFKDNVTAVGSEMIKWLAACVNLLGLAIKGWREIFKIIEEGAKKGTKELSSNGWKALFERMTGQKADVQTPLEEVVVTAQRVALPSKPKRGGGGDPFADLQEVVVTAKPIIMGAMEELYQSWIKESRTASQAAVDAFEAWELRMQDLVEQGRISAEQYAKVWKEKIDEVLEEVQVTAKRVPVPLTEQQTKLREFAKSVGDGIANAMKEGALHGLDSLRDVVKLSLRNILADIVSSGIENAILNMFSGIASGKSSGGFFGAILGGFARLFGFGKAGGGLITGPTLVGENGPELAVPVGSARVYNAAQMRNMGGGSAPVVFNVSNNVNVAGDVSEKNQAMIFAAVQQGNARTQREIMRMLERNGARRLR